MRDLSRLKKVKTVGGKIISQCPACEELGADKKGNHLVVFPSEAYHCIINESKEHLSRVSHLAGWDNEREFTDEEKRAYAKNKAEQERKEREAAKINRAIEVKKQRIRDAVEAGDVLAPYRREDWRARLFSLSPISLSGNGHALLFVQQLFNERGLIWMGDVFTTGKPEHEANFRTAKEWGSYRWKENKLPPRIAAGIFKAGSFSRGRANVIGSPYLVIENDEITKSESYALARFLCHGLRLKLRAIIDTGNKSLHMWFDSPPEKRRQALRPILESFKCDMGLFDRADNSPLRVPGTIHDKTQTPAELLWLNY